jgi:2-phospho-L-lactate/phosphoenolpyruvate guanylyltransferase
MFPDASRAHMSGAVIPIRAFALGKARLAASLDGAERAALGRRWAEQVVHAAGELPIVVVSSDPDVTVWATDLGLDVLDDPGSLDDAARVGRDRLRDRGCSRVIVVHADLPRAHDLARLARDASQPVVALVPCHRDDGTPVLSVPAAAEFRFAYGPDSFRRHAAEARRLGLGLRVVRDRDLAFDVDIPADLVALGTSLEASAASAVP